MSSAGYAIGYLGGGTLLAINLLMIQKPALFGIPDAGVGTRLALVERRRLVGRVLDSAVPAGAGAAGALEARRACRRQRASSPASAGCSETFHELRRYRKAFILLLAFLLYNDGIQTMIRMATIYGTGIGLPESAMITALLLTQFIGVPCAFAVRLRSRQRIGAKTAVFVGLAVYVLITILGYFMTTAVHFFALAILVGMVQGGTQALSRSLFASMIPRHKSSEFFAFFSVFERYAGVLGPAIFAFVVERSGSGRSAILAVAAFFVIGGGDSGVRGRRRRASRGARRRGRAAPLREMSARADRPVAGANAMTHVFYRVDQAGCVPAVGAVLLLPNHPNALLDPAIVWATAGRDVRFLAKSTLFGTPRSRRC